jgi:probable O-glycosylation ligase (exosortase A-associated)
MKGALFTYVLAYGGAAVSLVNPFVGLLIYVCFGILKPDLLWAWSLPGDGHFSRIVAIALLLGWGFKGFGRWELGKAKGIVLAFVGFWFWAIISAANAPDHEAAWTFVEGMAKLLLPFLAGITLIDSVKKLKQLAWVLLLSQGYLALHFNVSYYQGFNIVTLLGFGGDNNTIAIGMVTAAGLAFFLGLAADRPWHKAVAFTVLLLIVNVVFFSFSRGGMLALLTLGVVVFMLIPKRVTHHIVFALAVLLALRLAGPEVRDRFATAFVSEENRDYSAQSRVELWGVCWDMMLNHPILGVGPDHFPLRVHQYGWRAGKEAHTLWLQTGAELGFPGLLFLTLFYGLGVIRLVPLVRARSRIDPFLAHMAAMVIASLTGFALSVQFVSAEGLELPYYVALIAAGVLKLTSLKAADVVDVESSEVPDPDLSLDSSVIPPGLQDGGPVGAAGKDRSVTWNPGMAQTETGANSPPATTDRLVRLQTRKHRPAH